VTVDFIALDVARLFGQGPDFYHDQDRATKADLQAYWRVGKRLGVF